LREESGTSSKRKIRKGFLKIATRKTEAIAERELDEPLWFDSVDALSSEGLSVGMRPAREGAAENLPRVQTTPAASRRFRSKDYKESMESLILAQNER
jgi:hypothetical protein